MKTKYKKSKVMKSMVALMMSVGLMVIVPLTASAHCDTMEGPVIGDAKKAIAENNINYITKWVLAENEAELIEIFNTTMEVRDDSTKAQNLADKYLYENLVRIHRNGEGASYTGIKPEGTPVERVIAAADESIVVGNLKPLEGVVEAEKIAELAESFENVLATKDFEVNDIEAGRKYVEAYVKFTHLAEGEHAEASEAHEAEETHKDENEKTSSNWIPWTLAGVLLVTTVISHIKLFKSKK